MNEKIKKTYLIQRLNKPTNFNNPFSFGGGYRNGGLSEEAMKLLSPIFSFDYMGSAEFEFGAVPEAFQKLSNAENVVGEVSSVFYICPKELINHVEKTINKLIENEYELNLKESCRLKQSISGDGKNKNCGWIELDNGFMFFTDKEMFEKTKALFVE